MIQCRLEWPAPDRFLDHACTLPEDHRGDHTCGCGAIRGTLPDPARIFRLLRRQDQHGVSGTGFVAEGIEFSDGTVATRWTSATPCTQVWASLADMLAVHGHEGTQVVWVE